MTNIQRIEIIINTMMEQTDQMTEGSEERQRVGELLNELCMLHYTLGGLD